MNIENIPFSIANWEKIDKIEMPGESGKSFWQVFEKGNIRVRIVEYSSEFRADHWCSRGHILFVFEGELQITLKNGKK